MSGAELYSLLVQDDGSVPAMLSYPPAPVISGVGSWMLFGGFLKACVDCVDWNTRGIHWTMQPGGYGRITLHSDPQQTTAKYAYYQKPTSGTGPDIVQVILAIDETAAARIMSSGALVKGKRSGVFYMYVNVYGAAYFDEQHKDLAHTASVYTV